MQNKLEFQLISIRTIKNGIKWAQENPVRWSILVMDYSIMSNCKYKKMLDVLNFCLSVMKSKSNKQQVFWWYMYRY